MDQSPNIDTEEIGEGIADDLTQSRKKKENAPFRRTAFEFKPCGRSMLFGAVVFPVLVSFLLLFFGCGEKKSAEDLDAIKGRLERMEKKIARLEGAEEKIARLEGAEEKIAHLEGQVKELQQSIKKLDRSVAAKLKGQAIQERATSHAKKIYHVVRRGDTLLRIARQYGMSLDEVCSLNRITPKKVIRPGHKLLVNPGSQR